MFSLLFSPVQYSTIDFAEKVKKNKHIHMMGMADKYTFEDKSGGRQPGPGAYNSKVNTLELSASKSGSTGPVQENLAFGSSKAQNDKL